VTDDRAAAERTAADSAPAEVRAEAAKTAAEDARRGLDRLVFFSDAVVAIAITLIVLPLVDLAREPGIGSTADFFRENSQGLAAAGLGFVVIASFWREHHRLFNRAIGFTRLLVSLNLLWLAGIAFLPLATVLKVSADPSDLLANGLYIGVVGLTMLLSRAEELVLVREHLFEPGAEPSPRQLQARWVPVALILIAFVVSLVWPALGLWPVALLVLSRPIGALVRRIRPRTARPSSPAGSP